MKERSPANCKVLVSFLVLQFLVLGDLGALAVHSESP
jgi:hypothetical protein